MVRVDGSSGVPSGVSFVGGIGAGGRHKESSMSSGWREDPALQDELAAAEQELQRQEEELREARVRAEKEEELMRREQLRISAMTEQENRRKKMMAEQQVGG